MRLSPLLALIAFGVVGCSGGSEGDGLSQKDQAVMSRTDEIVKRSGGDWEKVGADDRAYLTQEIGHGNQETARMFFVGMTGGLKVKGDPRAGGGPRPASP